VPLRKSSIAASIIGAVSGARITPPIVVVAVAVVCLW